MGTLQLPPVSPPSLEVVADIQELCHLMLVLSIWPTVITGVVGVVGIAGTILAARIAASSQTANLMLSMNEERSRSRFVDKRQVYANFVTATHEATLMMTWVHLGRSQGKEDVPISELYKLRAAMYSRLSEVELVGSEQVISRAQALSRFVTHYFGRLIEPNLVDPDNLPKGQRLPVSETIFFFFSFFFFFFFCARLVRLAHNTNDQTQ